MPNQFEFPSNTVQVVISGFTNNPDPTLPPIPCTVEYSAEEFAEIQDQMERDSLLPQNPALVGYLTSESPK